MTGVTCLAMVGVNVYRCLDNYSGLFGYLVSAASTEVPCLGERLVSDTASLGPPRTYPGEGHS